MKKYIKPSLYENNVEASDIIASSVADPKFIKTSTSAEALGLTTVDWNELWNDINS